MRLSGMSEPFRKSLLPFVQKISDKRLQAKYQAKSNRHYSETGTFYREDFFLFSYEHNPKQWQLYSVIHLFFPH